MMQPPNEQPANGSTEHTTVIYIRLPNVERELIKQAIAALEENCSINQFGRKAMLFAAGRVLASVGKAQEIHIDTSVAQEQPQ